MSLTIRPRAAEDIRELARILVQVHKQDGYPVEGVADPEKWLTHPREIAAWTATHNNRPIGQVSLIRAADDDDAATIWLRTSGKSVSELAIPARLFVAPAYREHGAGRRLMLTALGFANERCLSVAFDVMLKDHSAIRLYEKLGCQRIGTITHHCDNGQPEPAAVYEAPCRLESNPTQFGHAPKPRS